MPYVGHDCKAGREHPSTQFTVDSSQPETRTSGWYLGSIRKAEHGKRRTVAPYLLLPHQVKHSDMHRAQSGSHPLSRNGGTDSTE